VRVRMNRTYQSSLADNEPLRFLGVTFVEGSLHTFGSEQGGTQWLVPQSLPSLVSYDGTDCQLITVAAHSVSWDLGRSRTGS
jgi:hypothetical protein